MMSEFVFLKRPTNSYGHNVMIGTFKFKADYKNLSL